MDWVCKVVVWILHVVFSDACTTYSPPTTLSPVFLLYFLNYITISTLSYFNNFFYLYSISFYSIWSRSGDHLCSISLDADWPTSTLVPCTMHSSYGVCDWSYQEWDYSSLAWSNQKWPSCSLTAKGDKNMPGETSQVVLTEEQGQGEEEILLKEEVLYPISSKLLLWHHIVGCIS